MAEKRYTFATFKSVRRKLERVDISIVKWDLDHEVKFWDLPRRLSRFWLIYWNDTPGAALEFRDRTVTMTPGNMVLIPPYTLVTGLTEHPFIHNYVEFEAPFPFNQVKSEPLVFPVKKFVTALPEKSDTVRVSLALYALAERLLLEVPKDHFGFRGTNISEPRVKSIMRYIDKHDMNRYSIAELARLVHLSSSRLLHLFKKETGITPREYWMIRRMELVQRMLLETDYSIPEIAEKFGFTDRSHLSRVMKSVTRLTPAEVRKMQKIRTSPLPPNSDTQPKN